MDWVMVAGRLGCRPLAARLTRHQLTAALVEALLSYGVESGGLRICTASGHARASDQCVATRQAFFDLRIHCFEIKCMRGNTNTDVVVARQEMAMRSGLDLFGDVCQCHGAVTGRIVDEFDVCESNVKRL